MAYNDLKLQTCQGCGFIFEDLESRKKLGIAIHIKQIQFLQPLQRINK